MKNCSRCHQVKSAADFHRSKKAATGLTSWCKACYRDHFPKALAPRRSAGLCDGHGEPRGECARCQANMFRRSLRNRGLTIEQYQVMFEAQGGVCKVCGSPGTKTASTRYRTLVIDHEHKTGVVRGLLCSNCNIALGHAKESTERLAALAEYLEPTPEWIGAGC